MFITKYTPNGTWLNDMTQPFTGTMSSRRPNRLTEYGDPDEIFDSDPGSSDGGGDPQGTGPGSGPGGIGGSYGSEPSPTYPTDCDGIVTITMENVPYPCSCNPSHMPWERCGCEQMEGGTPPGYHQIPYYICQEYDFIDNEPVDGSGNTGGVSTTDPSEDDPSISVIVNKDKDKVPEPKTDCESLKQLVSDDALGSNILPVVNELREKLDDDKEWSIDFENKWVDGDRKNLPDENGIREGTSPTRSKFKFGTTWVGQIHTHPTGTYSIFSWLDLKAISTIYTKCHENFNQDVFLMAVAPNNVTYALRVSDIEILSDKIEDDLAGADGTNDDEKGDDLMDDMAKKYRKSDNIEQKFLELYGNYGISIYKASDQNLSNWKLLELNETNNENVDETACN